MIWPVFALHLHPHTMAISNHYWRSSVTLSSWHNCWVYHPRLYILGLKSLIGKSINGTVFIPQQIQLSNRSFLDLNIRSSTYTCGFAAQSFHQSRSSGTLLAAMLFRSLAYWLTASPLTLVGAIPSSLIERQDSACTNTPRTRQCWSDGYSISTDFDAKAPPAGTTVTVRPPIISVI